MTILFSGPVYTIVSSDPKVINFLIDNFEGEIKIWGQKMGGSFEEILTIVNHVQAAFKTLATSEECPAIYINRLKKESYEYFSKCITVAIRQLNSINARPTSAQPASTVTTTTSASASTTIQPLQLEFNKAKERMERIMAASRMLVQQYESCADSKDKAAQLKGAANTPAAANTSKAANTMPGGLTLDCSMLTKDHTVEMPYLPATTLSSEDLVIGTENPTSFITQPRVRRFRLILNYDLVSTRPHLKDLKALVRSSMFVGSIEMTVTQPNSKCLKLVEFDDSINKIGNSMNEYLRPDLIPIVLKYLKLNEYFINLRKQSYEVDQSISIYPLSLHRIREMSMEEVQKKVRKTNINCNFPNFEIEYAAFCELGIFLAGKFSPLKNVKSNSPATAPNRMKTSPYILSMAPDSSSFSMAAATCKADGYTTIDGAIVFNTHLVNSSVRSFSINKSPATQIDFATLLR